MIDIVIEVAIFFCFKSLHVLNASIVILARFCAQLVRKIQVGNKSYYAPKTIALCCLS